MKKIVSLALCLALCLCAALPAGAEAFASFVLPEGAANISLANALESAPEGLAAMYRLMDSANPRYESYLFRMKNGRALLSVSHSWRQDAITVEALKNRWPQIAKTISGEVTYVDAAEGCAALGSRFGYDTLEIETTAVVGDEANLKLELRCSAFCRANELVEVWCVYPAETAYLFDDVARAERASDVADMEALLKSLDFRTETVHLNGVSKPETEVETEWYEDPDGLFTTQLPKGCAVLTRASEQSAFNGLRARLVEKYGEGAGTLFDLNEKDVKAENATMAVLSDLSATAMFYRAYDKSFEGATVADLQGIWQAVEASLTDKFGYASCMQKDGALSMAGREHAWEIFWLRAEGTDMLLNLMSVVDEGNHLRETDVFFMVDEAEITLQTAMLYTIVSTLQYNLPPEEERP